MSPSALIALPVIDDSPPALSLPAFLICFSTSSAVGGWSRKVLTRRFSILCRMLLSTGVSSLLKTLVECGSKTSAFCLSFVASSPSGRAIFIIWGSL
eukprot:scaffold270255_cov28-Attheya_sp.AAC.1